MTRMMMVGNLKVSGGVTMDLNRQYQDHKGQYTLVDAVVERALQLSPCLGPLFPQCSEILSYCCAV